MWVLAAVSLFFGFLFWWFSLIRRYPRGPPPLPLIGNLLSIKPQRIELQLLEWSKKYGPIFTVWLPHPMVIFADHKTIKSHFVKNADVFAGRPKSFAMELLCGGNCGLVFNDNAIYKEQRRFALQVLKDLGFGKAGMEVFLTFPMKFQRVIIDLAHRTVEKLRETNGKPIVLKPFLVAAVTNVIHQLVFGEILDHDDAELLHFKDLVDEALEAFFHPLVLAANAAPGLRHLKFLTRIVFRGFLRVNRECLDYIQMARRR